MDWFWVVLPLLHTNEYGAVPPFTVRFIDPLGAPPMALLALAVAVRLHDGTGV
jgi:hypothetical protein